MLRPNKYGQRVDQAMRIDVDFLNAVSQGTGDIAKVRLRFARFREMMEKAIS